MLKQTKRESKKLTLHTETVRNLRKTELAQVAGGIFSDVFCSNACGTTEHT